MKREHLVAAGLVGTVVVVVGFASGLGIRQQPAAGATEAGPPVTAPPSGNDASPPAAAGSAADGSSGSGGGSGYYSTGGGGAGGGAGGISYVGTPIGDGATPTSPPATEPPSTQPPTTPTSPPTTPPTTGNPVPDCQEGLVPAVLDTVTNAVVAVPVAGPALGTLGITDLGGGLLSGIAGLGLLSPGSGSSTTDNPLAGIVDPLVVTCVAQPEIPASAPKVVLGAGS